MSYRNWPLLFDIRNMKVDPEAHIFLVPEGERTHENMNNFNKKCEEWQAELLKNEPWPENIRTEKFAYEREDYKGRGIVYRPDTDEKLPTIIFTHGGSYLFWSIEYYNFMCSWIASKAHCVVVNLDFRMNIDVLIPDMFEDAYAGILAAVEQADKYGIDTDRLALMGDSSGSTIAAGLSIMCRDRKAPKISHRFLLAGGIGFDPEDLDNGNVNAAKTELMGAQNVVRRGFESIEQSQSPYFSPINDKHMEQCPPTTLIVGTADYMWREVSIYAKALVDAGVKVNVGLFQGMPHGFYNGYCGQGSKDFFDYMGEIVKEQM
jgi:acetyl esterase